MLRLKHLYLNNNQMTGVIDKCPLELEILSLSNNRFNGDISRQIREMYYLRSLNLSQNSFVGTLPDLPIYRLQYVNINSNSLTGTIPSVLGRMTNLNTLNLASNMLTGTIPVLDQSTLQDINLSDNYLTMGSLKEVLLSTFSASALDADIDLLSNCLVFRNPFNIAQDADATHCGGEQALQNSCCNCNDIMIVGLTSARHYLLLKQDQTHQSLILIQHLFRRPIP